MTKTVISATSNHNTFGLKYLLVRSAFRRTTAWKGHVHARLFSSEQHDREEAESGDRFWGHFRDTAELSDVDVIGR